MTKIRGNRRSKQGVVVSNKMNKTVVVRVDRTFRHPVYEKVVTSAKRYYAQDDTDSLEVGSKVVIVESRPISKTKRWRVVGSW